MHAFSTPCHTVGLTACVLHRSIMRALLHWPLIVVVLHLIGHRSSCCCHKQHPSKQMHKTLSGSPRLTGQCLGGNALYSTGYDMLLISFAWMQFCSPWEN
jgi:hypothetical protein